MNPARLAASLVFSLAVCAVADPSATIKTGDKAALQAAKGSEATVEGVVAKATWSPSGKVCNIDFEGEPNFVVAVFEKSKAKMDEAFGGDFTKQFTGATIRVTGKLSPYGGRDRKYSDALQIIVSQTNQVTVMKPATQPTTAPAGEENR